MAMHRFEPKILGFLCNWCCYAAADSAGISRFQYPPNIRVIRMMCTGRMDPLFIIQSFYAGIDGVFVGGWLLGECHYQFGNYDAIVTACATRKILVTSGIHPDRFTLNWASAADAPLYVKLITNFTNHIKELGPLGQPEGISSEELNFKLSAAKAAVKSMRLRTQLSKLVQNMREHDDYSSPAIEAKISEKLKAVITLEIEKQEKAIVESSAHPLE